MPKHISLVFSFYNEEDVLNELIQRARKVFSSIKPELSYELLFVNDNSTDRSLEILKNHSNEDKHIKIINMSKNFGVSECTLAGMKYATGDAVIIMDADLQDPPEVIPELINKWREENADVVYTIRTHRDGEPFLKKFFTKLGYKTLRFFSTVDLPIESGDFKLMSRRAVNHIIQLEEKEPFLRGLVRWVGFKQVPIFYKRDSRHAGDTHFLIFSRRVLKNFLSGITSFSDVPLYIIFILGILVSSGAFLFLIAIFIMKFLGWSLPGWSALMATVLTFGGLQILSLGIIGIYIAKIHIEVKRRPNFIVESTIGFDNEPIQK